MPTTTKGKQQIIGGIIEVLGDTTQPGKFVWLIHYPGDASADAATAPVLLGAPLGSIATSGEGTPDAWIKTAATTWVSIKGSGGAGVSTYAALTDTNVVDDTPGILHTWNGNEWNRTYGADWTITNNSAVADEEARLVFGRDLTPSGFGVQLVVSQDGALAEGNPVGGMTLQDEGGALQPRFGRYSNQNLGAGGGKYAELIFVDSGDASGNSVAQLTSVDGSGTDESRLTLNPELAELKTFGTTGVTSLVTASLGLTLTESTKVINLNADGTASLNLDGDNQVGELASGTFSVKVDGAAGAITVTTGTGQTLLLANATDLVQLSSSFGGVNASPTSVNLSANSGATLVTLTAAAATITGPAIALNSAVIRMTSIPQYADNAAALIGGLSVGDIYRTSGAGAAPLNAAGILMVVV